MSEEAPQRYDYTHFWTNTEYRAAENKGWNEIIRRHVLGDSVLDFGCGSGRFVRAFDGLEYVGVDISPRSIHNARMAFPRHQFELADLTDYQPNRHFGTVFSWTTLEHIWPEKIEAVAETMKKAADRIIIVEPLADDLVWAGHCFKHDYEKLFNITHKEPIEGQVYLMVAEGEKNK